MLRDLALRLQESSRARNLFFLILTGLTIALMGYRFGTFDQTFHIPYLKALVNPSLYARDPLIQVSGETYSVFWMGMIPFYRLDLYFGFDEPYILQTVMFVLHILATYLTFRAIWELSQAFFENPLTSMIAAALFVPARFGSFSAFPVFEFSLLNRTFVLPFVLFALSLQLRGRTALALGLVGLLANLHVLTALFGLSMIGMDCLANWRSIGRREIGLGTAACALMTSPLMLWKTGSAPLDFGRGEAWLNLMIESMLSHLYRFWGHPLVNVLTLGGLGVLAMYWLARHHAPSRAHRRSQDAFFLGAALILLIQVLSMYVRPVVFLMQLQLMRAGMVLLILAYIGFANYLAQSLPPSRWPGPDWGLLAATAFNPFPVVVPVVWAVQRAVTAPRLRLAVGTLAALGLVTAFYLQIAPYLDIMPKGIQVYPERNDWYLAQRWARDHTPVDALFITPPQLWSFADPDWRVYSERGTVVALADLLEVALVPGYQPTWQARFEALAPGAIARFDGTFFDARTVTGEAFDGLSSVQLEEIARRYGAAYLVMQSSQPRPFTLCYENPGYLIYALDPAAAVRAGCQVDPAE